MMGVLYINQADVLTFVQEFECVFGVFCFDWSVFFNVQIAVSAFLKSKLYKVILLCGVLTISLTAYKVCVRVCIHLSGEH